MVKVRHEVGENDVLKKLGRNGSQGHGSVVYRQMFVPHFEDRCYVGVFPIFWQ